MSFIQCVIINDYAYHFFMIVQNFHFNIKFKQPLYE